MELSAFVARPVEVRASQITFGGLRLALDLVQNAGHQAEIITIGAIVGGVAALRVATEKATVSALAGDWLVFTDDGHLDVYSDENFRRAFTPAPAPAQTGVTTVPAPKKWWSR